MSPTPALTFTLSPANPAPGATVTATYAFTNAPADHDIPVHGEAQLDGVTYDEDGTLHLTHKKGFTAPTAPGMTFVATSDPTVWTATAPAS